MGWVRWGLSFLSLILIDYSYAEDITVLQSRKCENYEVVQQEFSEAKAKWGVRECYDFTFTFLGYTRGPKEPLTVEIRNGFPTQTGVRSMDGFFDLIESMCFRECPESGAARCVIAYDDIIGYPTSIFIDVDEFMADEERIFRIENFTLLDCDPDPVNIEEQGNLVALPMSFGCNYSDVTSAIWNLTKSNWSNPACYDYSFESTLSPTREIRVRNWTTNDQDLTINGLIDFVEKACFHNCEAPDSLCEVTLSTDGYPTSVFIQDQQSGAEMSYYVRNMTVRDCEATRENLHCQHYDVLKSQYKAMQWLWKNPQCYDFSYSIGDEEPIEVQVRAGIPLEDRQTVNSLLETVRYECLEKCEQQHLYPDDRVVCDVRFYPAGGVLFDFSVGHQARTRVMFRKANICKAPVPTASPTRFQSPQPSLTPTTTAPSQKPESLRSNPTSFPTATPFQQPSSYPVTQPRPFNAPSLKPLSSEKPTTKNESSPNPESLDMSPFPSSVPSKEPIFSSSAPSIETNHASLGPSRWDTEAPTLLTEDQPVPSLLPLRSFLVILNTEKETSMDALSLVFSQYLSREMMALYRDSFAWLDLSYEETEYGMSSTMRLVVFGGVVTFSTTPPRRSDFHTEQELVLDNLGGLQSLVSSRSLGIDLMEIHFGMDETMINEFDLVVRQQSSSSSRLGLAFDSWLLLLLYFH